MTTTITLAEARTRMRAIAAEHPDYTYGRPQSGKGACVYFDPDGMPSCIVGCAFEHELRAIGIDAAHPDNTLSVHRLIALPLATLARAYLADIQNAQDSGVPWGLAVASAEDLADHEAL